MTAGPTEADDPSLDASALYGLAPDEFTAARNDLVKRLRAAGRKDEASGIARMRKPPVTVWALNQMARQRPDVVAVLFDAGAGLRAAMDAALAGDSSGVRPARAAERDALNAALAEASRQLDDTGHPASEATRRRMEATLRAAMADESVAEALSQGTLDGDHDAPGFGFDSSTPMVPDPAEKAQEEEEAARQAAARRAHLTETAERLAHRADELERAALDAEATAQRARQAADEARAHAADARLALEEAGEAR